MIAAAAPSGVIWACGFLQMTLSVVLMALILMHSPRDGGMGGLGFTPTSQGGTHIVERNLTRITVGVAFVWFANTVILFRLFA